jgi:hypothetical protein
MYSVIEFCNVLISTTGWRLLKADHTLDLGHFLLFLLFAATGRGRGRGRGRDRGRLGEWGASRLHVGREIGGVKGVVLFALSGAIKRAM